MGTSAISIRHRRRHERPGLARVALASRDHQRAERWNLDPQRFATTAQGRSAD